MAIYRLPIRGEPRLNIPCDEHVKLTMQWSGYTPRIAFTLLYVLSIAIGKPKAVVPESPHARETHLSKVWLYRY